MRETGQVEPEPIPSPTKPEVSPLSFEESDVCFIIPSSMNSRKDLKDNEKQLSHFTDGETMFWRAFFHSDKGTRSW